MTAKTRERRTIHAPLEVRTVGDKISLRGYAAVFDSVSNNEVVRRSAFNRTLAQRDDVRLMINHEGVPIARTKSGTLRLSTDERGLLVEADLDASNPSVQELVSAMNRGDIDQMSFAFTANDDPNVDGIRELREVTLWDVAPVTYPWYGDTSVELNGDRTLVSLRAAPEGEYVVPVTVTADHEIRAGAPILVEDTVEEPEGFTEKLESIIEAAGSHSAGDDDEAAGLPLWKAQALALSISDNPAA